MAGERSQSTNQDRTISPALDVTGGKQPLRGTMTDHTVLKRPILLGSLALTILPFLLPIYANCWEPVR
jgi:hypothetical protein